jgi:hypothetical protein
MPGILARVCPDDQQGSRAVGASVSICPSSLRSLCLSRHGRCTHTHTPACTRAHAPIPASSPALVRSPTNTQLSTPAGVRTQRRAVEEPLRSRRCARTRSHVALIAVPDGRVCWPAPRVCGIVLPPRPTLVRRAVRVDAPGILRKGGVGVYLRRGRSLRHGASPTRERRGLSAASACSTSLAPSPP